jgi:hypothetical protein
VTSDEDKALRIFSLRHQDFVHILKFTSSISDFQSCNGNLLVLLREGLIKIFEAKKDFELKLSFLAFAINVQDIGNQDATISFPVIADISSEYMAYVYSEINE